MTQEEKELLFRDLSARLPYHVKVKVWLKDGTTEEGELDLEHNYSDVLKDAFYFNEIKEIKPYLRPMSSMTEKEEAELYKMASSSLNDSFAIFDWLNKNYFAYRTIYNSEENKWKNMFELGLALVAPEGMYNEK